VPVALAYYRHYFHCRRMAGIPNTLELVMLMA